MLNKVKIKSQEIIMYFSDKPCQNTLANPNYWPLSSKPTKSVCLAVNNKCMYTQITRQGYPLQLHVAHYLVTSM